MTDITKCSGKDEVTGDECPFKSSCFRYVAPAEMAQSNLLGMPYNKEYGECPLYWPCKPKKKREGF